ncbi:hypothetical protein [Chitinophaga sp. Cy-1792]|uniref:DUF6934 family protein n=1 Tax=Chitinophaga sp. Cy-1792 TaxID=2608339 RepID=UPI001423DA69|nr:hypothetical protein [Chitinophaga sp. Cy-1792]NIG53379.1 hypothetical protein [Chitinophaga sp. Cy-1792]
MLMIDFENTYNRIWTSFDLRRANLYAEVEGNRFVELLIKIDAMDDPEFEGYNVLSFGPVKSDGSIDTSVRLKYIDVGKVLSTILLQGWIFLRGNQDCFLIIDGSTDLRTILYHQILKNNRDYIEVYFRPLGIDYYVRRKRDDTYELDEFGQLLPKPMIFDFDYKRTKYCLYKYYALELNPNSVKF